MELKVIYDAMNKFGGLAALVYFGREWFILTKNHLQHMEKAFDRNTAVLDKNTETLRDLCVFIKQGSASGQL